MKYFLSICIFVRNEAPYFLEWINFHRLQGVEHFYVYHNAYDDDYETLRVIAGEGKRNNDITYVKWPGRRQQCKAYQDCLTRYGAESEWIAFIDTDEFLWAPWATSLGDMNKPVFNTLKNLKHTQDKTTGALAIHWVLFGSNGHGEKENGLVLERFTRCATKPNNHVKSICRPAAVTSIGADPHTVLLKDGFYVRNERGVEYPRQYANSQKGVGEILQIAHMHTKSYQEFVARKSQNPDCNSGRKSGLKWINERFKAHDKNEVENTILRDRYAANLNSLEESLCHC